MTLSELIQAMRTDLGDADGVLFADPALERCLIRAISSVSQDTSQVMTLVAGEIVPAPEGLIAELLLLLAEGYACSIMRGKTANAVNVSSGDKRIERTSQAKYWAELEADLLSRYAPEKIARRDMRQPLTAFSGKLGTALSDLAEQLRTLFPTLPGRPIAAYDASTHQYRAEIRLSWEPGYRQRKAREFGVSALSTAR